jgi:hypothetical protein
MTKTRVTFGIVHKYTGDEKYSVFVDGIPFESFQRTRPTYFHYSYRREKVDPDHHWIYEVGFADVPLAEGTNLLTARTAIAKAAAAIFDKRIFVNTGADVLVEAVMESYPDLDPRVLPAIVDAAVKRYYLKRRTP